MTFRVIQFEPWHMKEVLDNPPSDGSLETWRLPEDTNNFEVYSMLTRNISLLLEQYSSISKQQIGLFKEN